MAVTIKNVAERAGVGFNTVSRVISGVGSVHPRTRAKVLAAIEELHYIPDQMASGLRSRRWNILALLLPTITATFWTTIARGVEDEAESRGYNVFLCNTDDDLSKEQRYLEALLGFRVAGIVAVPASESASSLHLLRDRQQPFVQVHCKMETFEADVVRGDSYSGAVALTTHLLNSGARRVAYIGGFRTLRNSRDRLSGYEDVLARAGIEVDPMLVRFGRFEEQTEYAIIRELLDAEIKPDALFIANSTLAVGALHALLEVGIQIPNDMLVGSYYDHLTLDDYSSMMSLAIQPTYEMGRLSVSRLLERIAGVDHPAADLILPNRIILQTANGSVA